MSEVLDTSQPSQSLNSNSATKLSGGPGRTGATAPMMPTAANISASITSRISIIDVCFILLICGKVNV